MTLEYHSLDILLNSFTFFLILQLQKNTSTRMSESIVFDVGAAKRKRTDPSEDLLDKSLGLYHIFLKYKRI